MNIIIDAGSLEFSKEIALELMKNIKGINIEVCKNNKIKFLENDILIEKEKVLNNFPISKLANYIKSEYLINKGFSWSVDYECKIYKLNPLRRSCGSTVIGMAMGYFLAMKYGLKTLYLGKREGAGYSLGLYRDKFYDSYNYAKSSNKTEEEIREIDLGRQVSMDYYLKKGKAFSVTSKAIKVEEGFFIGVTDYPDLLMEKILSDNLDKFDRVILDIDEEECRGCKSLESVKQLLEIVLCNGMDVRCHEPWREEDSLEGEMCRRRRILWNRYDGGGVEGDFFVCEDGSSFTLDDKGRVLIHLDRAFGKDVANVVDILEGEDLEDELLQI